MYTYIHAVCGCCSCFCYCHPCFFLSFLLLARHRIRSKAIEIKVQLKYKDLPRKMREWVVFLAIGAEVDICTMYDDDHDPYFRIGKGKEPRKNSEIRTSLAYLPMYFYLTIVTSPILCLSA